MKIISEFHDYYDIGLSYGIDPLCVYKRKTEEYFFNRLTDDNPKFVQTAMRNEILAKIVGKTFHATGWTWRNREEYSKEDYDVRLVMFCGKVYMAVGFRDEYHYDIDSLTAAVDATGDREIRDYFYGDDKRSYYGNERKHIAWAYDQVVFLNGNTDFVDNVLLEADAPVLEFRNTDHGSEVKITVNPELKSLGFPKVMDSFTAFQTVSQYITNILGIKPNPTLEVDDSVRIAKHGFDAKSFRKEKKQK